MEGKRGWLSAVGSVLAVLGKILGTILLILVITGLIVLCRFAKYVKEDLSEETLLDLENFTLDQTSVVYYTDPDTGRDVELLRLYGDENRTVVSYDKLPKDLINACIAIEDKRFYDHHGVDWLRTLKASLNMFLGGEDQFGASTLTQQLIKNLTGKNEVTVRRKLAEIFTALEFEKNHTKNEILTWYLNTIYLGEGCYGVQSAARVYFGKDVTDLTTAECASLIGITKNPSVYDPYINREKNIERQKDILWTMYDQGFITSKAAYEKAKRQELVFVNTSGQDEEDEFYYSYFVDQVLRDVTNALVDQGYTRQLAEQMVRSGGLAIYSTYNPKVQAKVDAVYQNLDNIPKTKSSQQLQSGIAVIDNRTGDLVAVAGGVGEKTGSLTFNRATQAMLQPGSTIKPLSVFAPALDQGIITPATVYDDTPYSFDDSGPWPKNLDRTYRGLVSVDEAVQQSLNTVAVKVLNDLTPESGYRFAKEKMGLHTLVDQEIVNGEAYTDVALYRLALGGLVHGVTVKDMAAGYAALANQGVYREPRTYTRVVRVTNSNKEELILDNTQKSVTAVGTKAAWYMTYMLENTVQSGTGIKAQLENMAAAGKTGTTSSDKDRWFCGYTPYYTAAVWCGYDLPEEVILTESSVNPAITLWQKVMAGIHEGLEYRDFKRPPEVVKCSYCRDSGLLATEACKADLRGDRTIQGYLTLEDAPKAYCTTHKAVEICNASNQVANQYCSHAEGNGTHRASLLNIDRVFPQSGLVVQDQEYVIEGTGRLPSGYYNAVSPTGERRGETCVIHTREDMALPESEQPDEQETPEEPEGPQNTEGPEEPEPSTGEPAEPPEPAEPETPAEQPEPEIPPVQPEVPEENPDMVLPPNPFEQNMDEPANNTPVPDG